VPIPISALILSIYLYLPIRYAYTEHAWEGMISGTTSNFVVLLRVSTTKQGIDGNGIAAQRRDIDLFLKQQEEPKVIAEYVEVISGAKEERPVLQVAIEAAKKNKCPLLVQKVDRLTRDVELLGKLTKDKQLQIKIACLPNADNFQIHLFGILAAEERRFISQRTKAAMTEAKKRGVKFGNPQLAQMNKTRKHQAKSFADQHSKLILHLRNEQKTLRQICDVLNNSGIKTRKGSQFHPVQVHRILKRSNNLLQEAVAA